MNQDKTEIEVMHNNKFEKITLGEPGSWFKPPRIYLISLLILIILTYLFLVFKNNVNPLFKKSLPTKQTNKTSTITSSATPSSALNKVYEGKLTELNKDKIIVEATKSGQVSFNLKSTTVYYQCSDFNNINKCKVDKEGLKTGSIVKVFAVSQEVLYVLYK